MADSVTAIIDQQFELAEGPVWWQDRLWWVDIMAGTLHRWDPKTRIQEARDTGDLLGAAVPCGDGRWLLAQNRSLVLFDWQQGTSTVVAALKDEGDRNRCNDGKCDPRGRFWFGTMNMDSVERVGPRSRGGASGVRCCLDGKASCLDAGGKHSSRRCRGFWGGRVIGPTHRQTVGASS